jgi:hypothetical protein
VLRRIKALEDFFPAVCKKRVKKARQGSVIGCGNSFANEVVLLGILLFKR